MYRKYKTKQKVVACNLFTEKDFKATEVLNDENFLIFDWRASSGSIELSTRYILDKKKGNLIIAGDSGSCVARWYNEVSAEDMEAYVNSIDYFIEKMAGTTDKHTYHTDNIKEDFESIRNSLLKEFEENDEDFDEDEFNEDMDEILNWLYEYQCENAIFSNEVIERMEKYNPYWYESDFASCGKRVHARVYLWSVGYQMGFAQLQNKEENK